MPLGTEPSRSRVPLLLGFVLYGLVIIALAWMATEQLARR
jgi:hypothetical protein